MKKHLSILLSTILFLSLPARAETMTPDTTVTLTIADCRTMALNNNKEIAARARAVEDAVYTVRSARGNFMPNISARGTGLYSTADGGTNIMGYNIGYEVGTVLAGGVSIEQPLYAGGKISAAYRMAELNRDIAEAGRALTTTEVIEKTDEAYASVVRARAMVEVAEAYRELLGELLRSVERAYRNGMKPKNDVLKVQVKMNESLLSLRKAENALRIAKMNLCHYIGLPLTTDVRVNEELRMKNEECSCQREQSSSLVLPSAAEGQQSQCSAISAPDEDADTMRTTARVAPTHGETSAEDADTVGATLVVARTRQMHMANARTAGGNVLLAGDHEGRPYSTNAPLPVPPRASGRPQEYAPTLYNRPEYTMLAKQVEAARQDIRLQRANMLPTIGLAASYDYIHGIEINDRTVMDKGLFSAMLSVSVPLYHFGERTNKVRAAKARLQQAELEWQDMNEKMTLEIVQAANNVDEAVLERDIARRSLEQAEENMRVSQRMYDAGMETLSDLLEAQALWQQAYEQTVSADYNLHMSRVAYRKATGTL